MAFNVPVYTTGRFSFGPGIMYMGVAGTTPTIDVGAVKGDSTLEVNRTLLEVWQGSPQTLVQKYAIKEEITLKVSGIEWNMTSLSYLLGAGVTVQSGAQEQMDFGGDIAVSSRAIRFLHIAPDGSTIDIHLFNAQGGGKITIAMKEKDMHEFPYEFTALEGSVDFQNVALAAKKKKFRIIRTAA